MLDLDRQRHTKHSYQASHMDSDRTAELARMPIFQYSKVTLQLKCQYSRRKYCQRWHHQGRSARPAIVQHLDDFARKYGCKMCHMSRRRGQIKFKQILDERKQKPSLPHNFGGPEYCLAKLHRVLSIIK
jgi:hypothetical protein